MPLVLNGSNKSSWRCVANVAGAQTKLGNPVRASRLLNHRQLLPQAALSHLHFAGSQKIALARTDSIVRFVSRMSVLTYYLRLFYVALQQIHRRRHTQRLT
jgi:hypothetical protein